MYQPDIMQNAATNNNSTSAFSPRFWPIFSASTYERSECKKSSGAPSELARTAASLLQPDVVFAGVKLPLLYAIIACHSAWR